MNNYSITFKSLRAGTTYIVNIGGGTGAAVPLKGGAQPFVTQEDDSDDMFTPVRTQTGYVRIFDDSFAADGVTAFDWKDLIPATDTARPVTLTSVNNGQTVVHWQGFMQAQNFGGVLYGNPQEREFPVQCPLAALSASDVDATNRELKNFAYIIKQAFDNLTGITINSYIFQGGAKTQEMLLKLVDWQNMIMASDDGLTGKYDNMRVIQDVCQFWGWTCRVCGPDVLFTCVDDRNNLPSSLTLTQAQLNTMASGTNAGDIDEYFLTSKSLSGDIFANTNNDDYVVRGINRSMVTSDGNPTEKDVVGFAPSSVEKEMKGRGQYNEQDGNKFVYYTTDLLSFTSHYITGTCREGYASFNIADIKETRISSSGESSDVIRIKQSFSSVSADAYASLQSVFHHSFYDANSSLQLFSTGGLSLKAKIYRKATQLDDHDANNESIGNSSMYMRLGIGVDRANAKWWTGTAWSSSVSAFVVAIGNLDDQLHVRTGSSSSYSYSAWIPTNETGLYGKIFIEFLGADYLKNQIGGGPFDIHDFSVEFARSTTVVEATEGTVTNRYGNFGGAKKYRVIERAGSREYTSKNASKVRDEWNADLIYASDNDMENGYGVVLNADGSQMGKLTYGLASQYPEQHLANRVTQYWASSKRKLTSELKTNIIGTVTPRNTVEMDGTTTHPIAITHDWRDDITRLTLLQI